MVLADAKSLSDNDFGIRCPHRGASPPQAVPAQGLQGASSMRNTTERGQLPSAALVLRRWPFSETSLILRVLTPDRGVLGLLAKGVHRLNSGSFAVLDTWALVDLVYGGRPDADLLSLWSATLRDRHSGLDLDPERLAAAAMLAEIAEDAAPPGQPSAEVFDWLRQALHALDRLPPSADPAPILATALMRGLILLGLEPRLDGDPPQPGESAWFAPESGGLHHAAARAHRHARRLPSRVLAQLRRLAAAARAGAAAPDPVMTVSEPWDESLTILVEFLHYHTERAPRAWPLLQERRRLRRSRTA